MFRYLKKGDEKVEKEVFLFVKVFFFLNLFYPGARLSGLEQAVISLMWACIQNVYVIFQGNGLIAKELILLSELSTLSYFSEIINLIDLKSIKTMNVNNLRFCLA